MSRARINLIFLVLLFLCFGKYEAAAKQMAVIVNNGNGIQELTSTDVIKIFNLGMQKWSNGVPITIVVRDPATPEMELLLSRVYKVPPEKMKDFIARHKDVIMVVDSNQAMLLTVQSIPGAVGVIDVFLINQKVKVLKIDGKLPVEFGYILRGN